MPPASVRMFLLRFPAEGTPAQVAASQRQDRSQGASCPRRRVAQALDLDTGDWDSYLFDLRKITWPL